MATSGQGEDRVDRDERGSYEVLGDAAVSNADPGGLPWRSRLARILAFGLGVAVGAAGTWWWRDVSEWRTTQEQIDLAGVVSETSVNERERRLSVRLNLHNFGVRTLEVRDITVALPGVSTARSGPLDAWGGGELRPGESVSAVVHLALDCRAVEEGPAVTAVVTALDGHSRQVDVALPLADVEARVRQLCWPESLVRNRVLRSGADTPRIGRGSGPTEPAARTSE